MKDLLRIRVKALLLIAILLISVVGGLSAKKIAIIDAGSSGSRLYVYDIKDNTRDLSKEQLKDNTKGGALSQIENTQASVDLFLTTMTSKYSVPQNETIDLYVLATAGMRLVKSTEANSIYTKMKKTFLPGYELKAAMTISGQYEGLYAWIAANYKKENLEWIGNAWSLNNACGILEIGGASMQIAFYTSTKQSVHPKFGKVYSKSYLGGGVDQVFKNNDPVKKNKFGVALDGNLKAMIGQLTTKFVRLGRPINNAIDSAGADSNAALLAYAVRISDPDSEVNYHPKMNAEYIAYIFETWGLEGKTIKAVVESDWTEGAALDIVVNNQQPEVFNYVNPN